MLECSRGLIGAYVLGMHLMNFRGTQALCIGLLRVLAQRSAAQNKDGGLGGAI